MQAVLDAMVRPGAKPLETLTLQQARIQPSAASATNLPVVVYDHGGGWVIADPDIDDATPRLLSKQVNAIVVSVGYRHSPGAKFLSQHEEAAP